MIALIKYSPDLAVMKAPIILEWQQINSDVERQALTWGMVDVSVMASDMVAEKVT